MLDLASHKAFVTGEWYIPGHRLIGFRIEEPASIGCEASNGELMVEKTGIAFDEGSLGSVESKDLVYGSESFVENGLARVKLHEFEA